MHGFALFAQERLITGKITDAQTRQPLSSCSVYSLPSGNGVITNEDGTYSFPISDKTDSIAVSMVGYITIVRPVSEKIGQVINFEVQPAQNAMNEVVVEGRSKYTKAQRLIRKVIKNRPQNDLYQNNNFQCQVYDKIELDIKNINEKIKQSRLLKPLAFVLDNMDSTKDNEEFLPVYLSESIANFYYQKKPAKERYDYTAINSSGLDNKSMLTYIDGLYKKINVYADFIKFVDINFVSPVGADALNFYNFYLQDTMYFDNHRCIQVQFSPIRYGTNTFKGNVWIMDTSYAIKSIVMRIDKGANINWINTVEISGDFVADGTGKFVPKKNSLYIDLKIPAMKTGGIAKKTTIFKNFLVNNSLIDTAFAKQPKEIESAAINIADTSFWRLNRFDPLSRTERSVYKMMDTLAKIPRVITYGKIFSALTTGYYTVGNIDIGNLYNTFTTNAVEGSRFNIGAQTNYLFNKNIQLKSYIGASTLDKKYRYLLSSVFVLNRKQWSTLLLKYSNDLAPTYDNSNEFDQNSVFSSLLRRVKSNQTRLVNKREAFIAYKKYYNNGWGFSVSAKNSVLTPFFDVYYTYGKFLPYIIIKPGYNDIYKTNELSFTIRYSYKEKYVTEHYRRGSLGSNYPIIAFTYTKGLRTNNNLFKSDFDYHKLGLAINQDFTDGHLGQLSYTLEGSLVKGILPIVLLDIQKGNDTYYYNGYAFNNMNRFEFVSDKSISLSLQQIFGSFPFNLLPAIKKLKWRSLITFKGVLGGMSPANKLANAYYDSTLSYHFTVPDKTPYMETGVGIENIFHFVRLDAIWRLNYLQNPNIPKFGIKASLQLKF